MIMNITKLFWSVLLACSVTFGQAFSQLTRYICIPSSARKSSIDDVLAIKEALSACGNGRTIDISAGKNFNIHIPLDFSNYSGMEQSRQIQKQF